MSRCCLLHFRCQHERRQLEHKRNDPERTHTGDCFSYSVTVVGVENGNSRSLRPSHPLESPLVKETTAPEGSTSSLVSGVASLLLSSLPASISESSSDSAELDSSSDSSLFPNQALSGFAERCEEQLLLVFMEFMDSSGRKSLFVLKSFRLSCLRAQFCCHT